MESGNNNSSWPTPDNCCQGLRDNTYFGPSRTGDRVTKFGKISPLWPTFKGPKQSLKGIFCNWQKNHPTLGIFYDIGQIFIAVNGQILNK